MSHSNIPGVEQVGSFLGGGNTPNPVAPPATPTNADASVQEAEEEEDKAQGESANMLTGGGGLTGSTMSSRNVLLGA